MLRSLIPDVHGEETIMPSVTEPDQVLSLNEILMRYSVNGTLPLGKGVYDEDDDPQVGDEEFIDDPTRDPAFDFLDAHIYEREYELRQQTEAADASIERDHQADDNTEDGAKRDGNSVSSQNDDTNDDQAASD